MVDIRQVSLGGFEWWTSLRPFFFKFVLLPAHSLLPLPLDYSLHPAILPPLHQRGPYCFLSNSNYSEQQKDKHGQTFETLIGGMSMMED